MKATSPEKAHEESVFDVAYKTMSPDIKDARDRIKQALMNRGFFSTRHVSGKSALSGALIAHKIKAKGASRTKG